MRQFPLLKSLSIRVLLEPGRFLVGNAGVLLTRVLYVKKTPAKTFVIVDAGMNDLIRPALYQGYHEVVPVRESKDQPLTKVDVVGPVCESGDFFALDRELAQVESGDVLALMSAGAYGFTMASNYNSRPLPAEVLVSGSEAKIVRRRQSYADLIESRNHRRIEEDLNRRKQRGINIGLQATSFGEFHPLRSRHDN